MKLSSDFECGNGHSFRKTSDMRWSVVPQTDRPGYGHYFHFQAEAENETGQAIFDICGEKNSSDEAAAPVSTVWRRRGSSGAWERFPASAFFVDGDRLVIRQEFQPGDSWNIAAACPLPYSDLARHIEDMPTYCSEVSAINLGETPEGRPLWLARVTDPEVPTAEKGRIGIVGGQHGIEFAGIYAAKGALDFLASRLPQAAALRRRYIFDILPCANPDGNAHGLGCYNSEGRDQLTAFADAAEGGVPTTAEAALIWRHFQTAPPDLILNFHAYAAPRPFGDPPYEGMYVPDPYHIENPARRIHQHVLNHALFYLTYAGSQHRRPCPAHSGTLEENAARAWNSLSALYQIQAEEGPHRNLLTGISILRTVVETLELAQSEHESL